MGQDPSRGKTAKLLTFRATRGPFRVQKDRCRRREVRAEIRLPQRCEHQRPERFLVVS